MSGEYDTLPHRPCSDCCGAGHACHALDRYGQPIGGRYCEPCEGTGVGSVMRPDTTMVECDDMRAAVGVHTHLRLAGIRTVLAADARGWYVYAYDSPGDIRRALGPAMRHGVIISLHVRGGHDAA